jgi:hypothetical protein
MKINRRYCLLSLEGLWFILCSFLMFTLIASVGNLIGATNSPLARMLPYYLSVFLAVYLLFVGHLVLFPKNENRLKLTLKINGIILTVLGFLTAVLFVVYVVKGTYSSFVMGGVSPLFPLDLFLLDLLVMAAGIYFVIKAFRFKAASIPLYFPYEHGLVRLIFASFFRGLYVLFALYLTGAFLMDIGIANYGSPTAWCMVGLWLLLGVPAALLFYHDFFYKNGTSKTPETTLRIALAFLIGVLVLEFYFLLCLLIKPNFIVEDATALFLLDYMKSWNAAPYIVSLMAILPPLVAALSSLPSHKDKSEKPLQKATEENKAPSEKV